MLGFTGLALVDIDHIGSEECRVKSEEFLETFGTSDKGRAATALDEAFEKAKADPYTLLAYRTVSGEGLRIIYRYEREGMEKHLDSTSWPAAFLKGNRYYAELTGCEFDGQCGDYGRLCGLAHDSEVYVNLDAEPFMINDEEILAANFDGSGEKGKARKEYATGTHSVSVDDAWPRVEQTLQKRGLVYQSGHHHDYVMHAAFLFNRYGVDLDELLEWAAQEWNDYDQKARESTIRSCYKKTGEHGTWRLNRQGRKSKETSMITLPEIREWLTRKVEVIYNVVTDISMWRAFPSPSKGGDVKLPEAWTQLDERVVCSIRSQMAQDTGKRVLKSDVMDVLRSDFARLYHPVREYIEALPQWDGKDRVKELCSHLTAEAVQPGQTQEDAQGLLLWALHKWLVAMVATWMSDHSTNHEIFVLIGQQGIYKTTFFRHLLPPP